VSRSRPGARAPARRMRRPEAVEAGPGAPIAAAGPVPGSVRVFRPQAVERYLGAASRSTSAPPSERPRSFAALWMLVAALVAAGLLIAWILAGELGYLPRTGPERAPSAAARPLGSGDVDG